MACGRAVLCCEMISFGGATGQVHGYRIRLCIIDIPLACHRLLSSPKAPNTTLFTTLQTITCYFRTRTFLYEYNYYVQLKFKQASIQN